MKKLQRVEYSKLNARQKENFNFQKASAVLADYGYVCLRLTDDWAGADFIAVHISGETLRVQLKSRLMFERKYLGKELYVMFGDRAQHWFLYPHDELLAAAPARIRKSGSWTNKGAYSVGRLSKELRDLLAPFELTGSVAPVVS